MAKLSFFGFLPTPVAINNPGDAVDVSVDPIMMTPGGIIAPQSELILYLSTLIASMAPWNTLTLHLFLDTLAPIQTTPLADFVSNEASFTGYTATALVWLTPENYPPGSADIPSQIVQFIATAVPTPQNVRGFFATHA
jgi:hypothetical protein